MQVYVSKLHQAAGAEPPAACELLTTALALWRGPALTGIGASPLADRFGPALAEEWLGALEKRVALDLAAEGRSRRAGAPGRRRRAPVA